MATLIVPYRRGGKTRLAADDIAEAMLADVLAACAPLGDVIVADAPGGQGEAVSAALAGVRGPVAVVNADLPCATTEEIAALLSAAPALVAASDGTTNAVAVSDARQFVPLYGPGSARRFVEALRARGLDLPGLHDDVDTFDDLERVAARVGANTAAAFVAA
jgi:2-phospho-L-lactate guanylyltransferase (CobY/MobA/RfbA family)